MTYASSIITANLVCIFVMSFMIIGMLGETRRPRSTNALICTFIVNIIGTIADAGCYVTFETGTPDGFILAIWITAYSCGTLALFMFMRYWFIFICEKTYLNPWLYIVPVSLVGLSVIYTIIVGLKGEIVSINDGVTTVTGGMPIVVGILQLFLMAYLPLVALTKEKEIGRRSVFLLGSFGVFPFVEALLHMVYGGADYSYTASSASLISIYILLQNHRNREMEEEKQKLLEEKNKELEELSKEQREQLKEIKSLNYRLEEGQAHLEESVTEQEAQLQEIAALNEQLSEKQRNIEARYGVVNSMIKIYFAAYYIDIKEDSYVTLSSMDNINEVIKESKGAQDSLYLACDKLMVSDFKDEMKEFLNLSTLKERMKDREYLTNRYQGVSTGWSRAYLIVGDRDEEGNPLHVFYAARLIHEEHRREMAQIEAMEEITEITSSAGLGMWKIYLKDGEEPRMEVNKKMAELLAIDPSGMTEEEIYQSWFNNVTPEAVESVDESVAEMMEGKFSENTYLWEHKDKGIIYVRCGGTSYKLADGTTVLRGYHYDVNSIVLAEQAQKKELEQAKKKAEAASEAKSTFLFNMSHDLRTPMNAIIGYTDLLEKNIDDQEKCKDYLGKINSSSNLLLAIINNVLQMAKIESGKASLDEEVVKCGTVLAELTSMYSELMENKKINFSRTVDIKTEYVYCDVVKIREVFLNVISNAFKYTPEGGSISVHTEELPSEKEGYIAIKTTVKDTGIGISAEFLPKIFDEFSRDDAESITGIQGTGLGMPIAKKLVELMGGSITVESELGKGTVFTVITEQRIADKPSTVEGSASKVAKADFAGKRVLLAEDNDFNAEIAMTILREVGFEVERAADGIICVDMLRKADKNYYNAILMDIQMPNMDGYKASRIIRMLEDEDKKQIPIIAMTANAFEEDRKNALEAGMNEHLAKPIVVDKLFGVLEKVL